MNMRRSYSQLNLTSLLDVVFLTLYLLILTMGDNLRMANKTLDEREQASAATATVALGAAEETVTAIQSVAQATSHAAKISVTAAIAIQNTLQATATLQAATATNAALLVARQNESLSTREAQLAALGATATAAAQTAQARVSAVRATPVAALATAYATMTIVAQEAEQQASAASTQVALAVQNVVAAEATATTAQATAAAAARNATEALGVAASEKEAAQGAMATAQSIAATAYELYEETQQILAAEVTDPGITIAKARWVDKYATFYLIRLSPYVNGSSTLELFRGGTFLGSRAITSQVQIGDFLTALDRDDVADTLVILTFSPDSSDNHREWILTYLNNYNFKYQRILEETE